MAPDWLKESMVERGLDVRALAEAAGVSQKTIYSILGGRAVSLATAGSARATPSTGAWLSRRAAKRAFSEPARHATRGLRVVSSPSPTS